MDREKFSEGERKATDSYEIFQNWLLENGGSFPKLEMKEYDVEVRGCHALEPLHPEETIISIPLKCLITVEMGKETYIGQKILENNLELDAPKHIFLMLFMLLDMNTEGSFFKPYYDILPATLNAMPIFWTEEELSYLQGSYLLQQINERNQAIEKDYNAICEIVPEFSEISSLERFKWARMAACSRNFGITVNGVKTAAMVPYADMLNHFRPRETRWQFEEETQTFTVISLEDIGVGEQVYDSYGQKSNHRFLLNYGFSVENNVEVDGYCPNEVPILVQLSRSDPLYDAKFQRWWIRESPIPSRRIRVSMTENDGFKTLMATTRIIVAGEQEFEMISPSQKTSPTGGVNYRHYRNPFREALFPLSTSNELQTVYLLKSIFEDYLARYKTTFEEDMAALAATHPGVDGAPGEKVVKPFSNVRNAIIQVAGEKEVLKFYLHLFTLALQLLHMRIDTSGNSSSSSSSSSGAAANVAAEADTDSKTVFQCVATETSSSSNGSSASSSRDATVDMFTRMERRLNEIRDSEANPMVYSYLKNHVFQIRLQDERKQAMLKRSVDYAKPTTM